MTSSAIVTHGKITARVQRWSYWDPRDGAPKVEVEFEVLLDLPDDAGGFAAARFSDPETVVAASSVCAHAAVLLAEAQRGG